MTENPLTANQVVAAAYAAGFRGDALVEAVAISKRESGWVPDNYNGNAQTGDNSVGMMQINIIGGSQQYISGILHNILGIDVTSRNEIIYNLNNPVTNFRVAYQMSNGGTSFYDWGPYKGVSALHDTNVPEAQAAVNAFLAESSDQQAHDIANVQTMVTPDNPQNNSNNGGGGIPVLGGIADATGAVGGAIKDAAGTLWGAGASATDAAISSAKIFANIAGWLFDWHHWAKIGVILGGSILVMFGLYSAVRTSNNTTVVEE